MAEDFEVEVRGPDGASKKDQDLVAEYGKSLAEIMGEGFLDTDPQDWARTLKIILGRGIQINAIKSYAKLSVIPDERTFGFVTNLNFENKDFRVVNLYKESKLVIALMRECDLKNLI